MQYFDVFGTGLCHMYLISFAEDLVLHLKVSFYGANLTGAGEAHIDKDGEHH